MTLKDCGFQRARSPEQVEQRRRAILDTASDMLRTTPIAEISLRELAARVGLAKSNVLRYFDSREAIFLEILEREQRAWLDELERVFAPAGPAAEAEAAPPFAGEVAAAGAIVDSLVARPLLCELVAAMAGVLERNISVEFARDFKRRANENLARLAGVVALALPGLGPASAALGAAATHVLAAGLWPYAQPTGEVRAAMAEMGMPCGEELFDQGLRETLATQFIGLRAREAAGVGVAAVFAEAVSRS